MFLYIIKNKENNFEKEYNKKGILKGFVFVLREKKKSDQKEYCNIYQLRIVESFLMVHFKNKIKF